MKHCALLCLACLSFAVAYQPNNVEQTALDCVRAWSKTAVRGKDGKFQIACDDNQPPEFDKMWLSTGLGGWDKLPNFQEVDSCSSKNSDPLFIKGAVFCAKKLFTAHCSAETTKFENAGNIDDLIATISPKAQICSPLIAPSKTEKAALECIRRRVDAKIGKNTKSLARVVCDSNGKLLFLNLGSNWKEIERHLPSETGANFCKSELMHVVDNKTIECVQRMLAKLCGKESVTSIPLADWLTERATPRENHVCE